MWRASESSTISGGDTSDLEPAVPDDVEWQILSALGYPAPFLAAARMAALRCGLTLAEELIRTRHLDPRVWWQAVADRLSLRCYPSIYLEPIRDTAPLPPFRRVRQALGRASGGLSRLYIAPRGIEIDRIAAILDADPGLRPRYAIASPITISHAIVDAYSPAITRSAIERLRRDRPEMSASNASLIRTRLIICVAVALALLAAWPQVMILLLNSVFLTLGGMRLAGAYHVADAKLPPALPDNELPTYAVLVPLYREAAVVPALTAALARLDYPRRKLSVFLIVEADDFETIAAVNKVRHRLSFRLIVVSASLPRTKPKALCWTLPFVESDIVTIFDAEDRPAPDQLRLAAATFAAGNAQLACVQAALEVDHLPISRSWISRQFALEYRVLFRSLLPWLAAKELFLPLGGTSNHFRRSALMAAGAWDPFNVTEDADLAVRLARLGWEIGVIPSTTSEEAPLSWRQWHYQRTRWMKGWLQTSLVHFGNPIRLVRDLGVLRTGLVFVLIPGQIASALAYPFGFFYIGLDIVGIVPVFADRPFSGDVILALHLIAFFCGWLGALMAIVRTARRPGRMTIGIADIALVPVYWALLFVAALAAPIELIRQPFRWNKTRHGLAARRGDIGAPAQQEIRTQSVFRRFFPAGRRRSAVIATRDMSAP